MLKVIKKIFLIKSFLFAVAILGLWGRSYFVADKLTSEIGAKSASLTSTRGLIIYRAVADGSDAIALGDTRRYLSSGNPQTELADLPTINRTQRQFGFSYSARPAFSDGSGLDVIITLPQWAFFLLAGFKAIIWSMRRLLSGSMNSRLPDGNGWCFNCQSQQRSAQHLCIACGNQVAPI